jgi:hypothetical protein
LREKGPPLKWTEFRWIAPSVLAAAWSIRLVLFTDTMSILESIIGMGALAFIVWIMTSKGGFQMVTWDKARGLVALFRPWSVEVMAGCLISSVPLGLDLTHSAKRLLQSLDVYIEEEDDSPKSLEILRVQLRFFVVRPLGKGPTRVGMLVSRKTPRIPGARRVNKVAEEVAADVQAVEGALRAAYPHTPIIRAGLDDMLMVQNGGIVVNAECD